MPNLSKRARLIQALSRYFRLLVSAAAVDEGLENEIDECEEALDHVEGSRYLSRRRPAEEQRHRDTHRCFEEHLSWNDEDFRRGFRVTKKGTVVAWTDRVLCALIAVESTYVWWPTAGERQQLRQELSDHHGLAGCVGFIDGTHVNFIGAPARHDAADFFNRHHMHSYNILAVVDYNLRFRFLHLGFPGSAHDQRVYRASALAQNPDHHFSKDEFILSDSGYTSDAHLVSLFRRFRGQSSVSAAQIGFNQHASCRRVLVEHAFELLKLRWQSLRALPISLKDALGEQRAACWIWACFVLHNVRVDEESEPGTG
ncbi:hypothetical protein A4X03_0g6410 [Tilletia caries]|uniref:DDE Tnp4 domain-containing protein n=1 Tax=Tilletia caries TaxID=13290 RepID=A0A8T8T033_9BASI|nr:hypothetical protein A4X03_0g6410 [Tilletia caries]